MSEEFSEVGSERIDRNYRNGRDFWVTKSTAEMIIPVIDWQSSVGDHRAEGVYEFSGKPSQIERFFPSYFKDLVEEPDWS